MVSGGDAVPKDAPAETNQTVVNSWMPAEYRHSDTASFTRDVDVCFSFHGYAGAIPTDAASLLIGGAPGLIRRVSSHLRTHRDA